MGRSTQFVWAALLVALVAYGIATCTPGSDACPEDAYGDRYGNCEAARERARW